jgi:hypothetical protein
LCSGGKRREQGAWRITTRPLPREPYSNTTKQLNQYATTQLPCNPEGFFPRWSIRTTWTARAGSDLSAYCFSICLEISGLQFMHAPVIRALA